MVVQVVAGKDERSRGAHEIGARVPEQGIVGVWRAQLAAIDARRHGGDVGGEIGPSALSPHSASIPDAIVPALERAVVEVVDEARNAPSPGNPWSRSGAVTV